MGRGDKNVLDIVMISKGKGEMIRLLFISNPVKFLIDNVGIDNKY